MTAPTESGTAAAALTERQITLIETSFRQVLPISGLAAELFTMRLLHAVPSLQSPSNAALRTTGDAIVAELGTVIASLRDPAALEPALHHLAGRLVARGVTPAMYVPIGTVMIDTLAHSLGEAFSAEMRTAWEAAYALYSEEMVQSAYPPVSPETNVAAE
ncbi:MAG: globin domain-containing protein [Pseudomonadota bacterium]